MLGPKTEEAISENADNACTRRPSAVHSVLVAAIIVKALK